MSHQSISKSNRIFVISGLSIALGIAVFLSPFASKNPDGLDRVAQDLEFESKSEPEPLANKLPFAIVFEEYAVRGVPEAVATPLAGLAGTIVTFGLAFGLGKLAIRQPTKPHDESTLE